MMRYSSHNHHQQCYPNHSYATVRITGVSLTKDLLQSLQPLTEIAFTEVPWVIVTDVGAAVDVKGMVNS